MGIVEHSSPRELPTTEELELATTVLKLLGDHTRLAILLSLSHEELSVNALASHLGRPVPATSQHLAKLRAAGLVATRREGTTVFYSQPDQHLLALVNNALDFAEHGLYARPPHHR